MSDRREGNRWLTSWFVLLTIPALCPLNAARTDAVESASHDPAPLRVMSFNVRYGEADDGPNHWRHRKELVVETVRQFDPDVMGTQELMGLQAQYFEQELPDYSVHGTSRFPSDPNQEQCAVYFRQTRFEKTRAGHFWLSDTPDVPGSQSWDSSLPRMVSWIRLRRRNRPSTNFYVFNTHFDHVGHEARIQSAALLRARIQRIAGDLPVIVMGDFNSDEGSLPQQVLLHATKGLKLQDTYRSVIPDREPARECTLSRWNGNRRGPRIDWILVSPRWNVSSAGIVRSNDQGRYPSDHYPVTAVLQHVE